MNKNFKILIADENANFLSLKSKHLSMEGFQTDETVSLNEINRSISFYKPDIFLLDTSVLSNEGIKNLRKCKEEIKKSNIYTLISSKNFINRENGINEVKDFVNEIIYEPVSVDDLVTKTKSIAEMKDIKDKLILSEERLDQIISTAQEGIWIIDKNNKITFVNETLCNILGYKAKEIIGKSLYDFLVVDDIIIAEEKINKRKKGKSEIFEFRFLRKDGKHIWTNIASNPVFDKSNNYDGIVAMISDITEKKNSQFKLQESEESFKLLFKCNPNPMYVYDADTLFFLEVNDAVIKKYGYSEDEFLKMNLTDIRPKEELEDFLNFVNNKKSKFNLSQNWHHILKSGEIIEVDISSQLINFKGKNAVLVSVTDVTEKNKALKSLKDSEEEYRQYFEDDLTADYLSTVDGKILDCNPAFLKVFGFKDKETAFKYNINDFYYRSAELSLFLSELKRKKKLDSFELKMKKITGEIIYVIINVIGVFDLQQNLVKIKGYIFDNTRQKLTEQALIESEQKYRSVVNNIKEVIFQTDANGKWIFLNEVWTEITGFELLETIGENFINYVYSGDREKNNKEFAALINKEKEYCRHQVRYVTKTGHLKWIEVYAKLTIDEDGNLIGTSGTLTDISERIEIESQLNFTRKKYKAVFDTSYDAIMLMEGENFTDCNLQTEKMFGLQKNEILSKTPYELSPEFQPDGSNSEEKSLQYINDAYAGKSQFFEWVHKRADGSEFFTLISINPVNFNGSNILQVIIRDITEQKSFEDKLKRNSKKFRSLLENGSDIITMLDNFGTIKYVSPSFEKNMGYKPEEVIDLSVFNFVHKDDFDRVFEFFNDRLETKGVTIPIELRFKHKSGEWRYIESIGNNLLFDPVVNAIVVNTRDITERKIAEKELRKAKLKAEEMNRLKSIFLANMSHEIRTPLVGILGFAELIQEESTEEEIKPMAEGILNSGKRLLNTLNSILDLSKIESNKHEINIEPIKIVHLIKSFLDPFTKLAEQKNLVIETEFSSEDIIVNLDESIFSQILNNLINNALKFTDKGKITVKVNEVVKDQNNFVEVKVIDTGIGIPTESQGIIFEEFRQASEGVSRNYEGSGLGLTLTEKFVKLLNGTIKVESEINKGSVFTIYFPAVNNSKTTLKKEFSLAKNLDQKNNSRLKNVLLVENDQFSIDITKNFLSGICNLEVAKDGLTAMNFVKEKVFDAILMDIDLGSDINGMVVTKEIRKLKNYKNIPIAALTAYAMKGDKERFLSSGCDYYMSKPFEKQSLIELVKKLIQNGQKSTS